MKDELHLDLRGVECAARPPSARGKPQSLRLDVKLSGGCHVVVVENEQHADALIGTWSGLWRPVQGRVRLQGHDPFEEPPTRASVVSLFTNESPLLESLARLSVNQLWGWAERQWGSHGPKRTPLPAALLPLQHRLLGSLDLRESRSLMLELALSHPKPSLALFYEPWSALDATEQESPEKRCLTELARLVERGTVVVLLTISERQAEHYGTPPILHPSITGRGRTGLLQMATRLVTARPWTKAPGRTARP